MSHVIIESGGSKRSDSIASISKWKHWTGKGPNLRAKVILASFGIRQIPTWPISAAAIGHTTLMLSQGTIFDQELVLTLGSVGTIVEQVALPRPFSSSCSPIFVATTSFLVTCAGNRSIVGLLGASGHLIWWTHLAGDPTMLDHLVASTHGHILLDRWEAIQVPRGNGIRDELVVRKFVIDNYGHSTQLAIVHVRVPQQTLGSGYSIASMATLNDRMFFAMLDTRNQCLVVLSVESDGLLQWQFTQSNEAYCGLYFVGNVIASSTSVQIDSSGAAVHTVTDLSPNGHLVFVHALFDHASSGLSTKDYFAQTDAGVLDAGVGRGSLFREYGAKAITNMYIASFTFGRRTTCCIFRVRSSVVLSGALTMTFSPVLIRGNSRHGEIVEATTSSYWPSRYGPAPIGLLVTWGR